MLQVWVSADFVFNIGCVCYRCGDRQILCLMQAMCVTGVGIGRFCVYYKLCVLQAWGSADFPKFC